MGKKQNNTLKFITTHTHSMVMMQKKKKNQTNKTPFGTKTMTTIFRKRVCKSFLIALEFGKSNSPDAILKVTGLKNSLAACWQHRDRSIMGESSRSRHSLQLNSSCGVSAAYWPDSDTTTAYKGGGGYKHSSLKRFRIRVNRIIFNCEFSDGHMWRHHYWAGAELLLSDRFC